MRIVNFTGLSPKTDPTRLKYASGTIAENCDFYSLVIEPTRQHTLRKGLVDRNGNVFTGVCKTLVNVGGFWVGFDKVIFWADDPRGCDCGTSVLFVDNGRLYRISTASLSKQMPPTLVGIDPPCEPPTVAVGAGGWIQVDINPILAPNESCAVGAVSGPACDNLPQPKQIRAYYFTYVNACGEESAPSHASTPIQVNKGEAVTITDNTTATPEGMVARRWYVYASAGEEGGAKGYYMGETAGNSFVDTMDPLLYQDIPINTMHWLPPIRCLEGVASIGDNLIVAWHGSYMYFSEVAMPHAFKRSNVYKIPHAIRVIKGFVTRSESAGHYVGAVLTDGRPYTIRGSIPKDISIVQFAFEQPYLSGYTEGEGAVYYNSPNALCRLSAEGFDLLTDGVLTEREYGRFASIDTCIGYGVQQIFTSSGMSFVVASSSKARETFTLSTHDTKGITAFGNDKAGGLFFVKGDVLYSWQDSTLPQTFTWRSKEEVMNAPMVFDTLKLVGDIATGDSIKAKVWGDGQVIFEGVFKRSGLLRLPRTRATAFMLEVQGRATVRELHLQTSVIDLALEGGMA